MLPLLQLRSSVEIETDALLGSPIPRYISFSVKLLHAVICSRRKQKSALSSANPNQHPRLRQRPFQCKESQHAVKVQSPWLED